MTKLIFGDTESIKLAKAGEIPPEAIEGKTAILRISGCEEACEHCTADHYECRNCSNSREYAHELEITDMNGEKRCKYCKFLIE